MKRTMAFALMLIFCLCPLALAEEADESMADDTFYEEYASEVPLYTDSSLFDIRFCVFDDPDAEPERDELHGVMFAVAVTDVNSNYPEFKMTVHLNPTLRSVLVSSEWYNEPFNLYAPDSGKVPHAAIYTWQTLVDLRTVAALGGLKTGDFYDVVLELTWKGGSEILRVSGDDIEAMLAEDWVEDNADTRVRLDDQVVQDINESASAYEDWLG